MTIRRLLRARFQLVAMLAVALSVTGCATNVEPVAKFGKAAGVLAQDYQPLLDRLSALCGESQMFKDITLDTSFDAQASRSRPRAECEEQAKATESRKVVASVIESYGMSLAELAGAKPDELAPDIDRVADAAAGLKDRTGTALVNPATLDAASKIVAQLVSWARSGAARRLTKELLASNQEPLANLVQEMRLYSTDTLKPRLASAIDVRQRLLASLVGASTSNDPVKAMPWRTAQFASLQEVDRLGAEIKRIDSFDHAAASLVEAHAQLRDEIDHLDSSTRIKALAQFLNQVKALNSSIQVL